MASVSTHPAMSVDLGASEAEATATAYREHADAVWSLLGRLGVAGADREDALQEVFIIVHRGWARFEGRSALSTWIHGITVRVAIAHRRRCGIAARRTEALDDDPIADGADPHEDLERVDAARVLDGLLDELEHDKRTVFVLSDVQGLPVPTVAEMLALNVRTAYSRLRVARADFERALQRWQARRAHVESPPAALAQLRRRAHEHAPRRTWIAIDGGRAVALGPWLAIGGAKIVGAAAVIGVVAIAVVAWPSARAGSEPSVVVASPPAHPSEPAVPTATAPAVAAEPAIAPVPAPRVEPSRAVSRPAARDDSAEVVPRDTTAAEIDLLRRARARVQAGAGDDAIALLDAHATMAADGRFAAEREMLRIEALCAAGRREAAQAIARAWAEAHRETTAEALLAERCR